MAVRVNMTGVSSGFNALPAGAYQAMTSKWSEKTAGQSANNPGSSYIEVEFTLLTGPDGNSVQNRKAWRNCSLLPQSLWVVKGMLVELGINEKDLEGDDCDLEPHTVGENPNTGKPNNQVSEVLTADTKKAAASSKTRAAF